MSRRLTAWVLAVGLAAQFGVLATMIVRRELALRHGVVCRFRTAPVDPYDAFRGRYVALSFDAFRGNQTAERRYARGQWLHARVGTDTNGYSVIDRLARRPDDDGIWMRLRVRSCWEDYRRLPAVTGATNGAPTAFVPTGRYNVHLDVPFDRYYLEERLAPEAEQVYRAASPGGRLREGVARVRVRRGLPVLEGVDVDGVPLREAARRRLEPQPR